MELQRLDPECGGASTISVDAKDEETFLGRNPTAQITDTLISRRQASIVFDKHSQEWKFKSMLPTKPCYHKKLQSDEWEIVSGQVSLQSGDEIALINNKYVYAVRLTNVKNKIVEKEKEKEKPKISANQPTRRVLPSWMLDHDKDENVSSKNKKDEKTPTKQV